MDDEDWDEEINSGFTTVPTKKFDSMKIRDSNSFENGGFNGRGRGLRSNDNRGFTRGRGRGRGFGRGSASDNWRNDSPQTNGFQSSGQKTGTNNYYSERNGFRSDRNDRSSPLNESSGFGGVWSRGRGRFNSSGGSRTDRSFNSSPASEPLRIEVSNDYIGKVIGKGGTKIREIQSESGARVKILNDEASLVCTPVDLFGTEEQQLKAKQLIKDLTIPAGDLRSWANRENRRYDEQLPTTPKINWGQLKEQAAEYEKAKWADCPEIIKYFYKELKTIALMDPSEVADIRMKKNNITVHDLSENKRRIPNPVLNFEDAFEDYPEILDTIYQNKFTEPSPIQSQAWPVILSGMDCIGIAQTGTGKTLAFLLPAFIHIDQQTVPRQKRGGPSCLVLSPTRELAQQIEMEVKKFHYKGIKSVCIYGGGDRQQQIKAVQQGVEIIIGTPGRLNDLLMNNFFTVRSVTFLILDEADRMLDMGFEPEIKKILLDIRPDRQTIMTSATWLPGVQRIADQYLKDPVRVNVGSMDLQACHSVTQLVEFINPEDKQDRTLEFLNSMGPDDKLIIFVGRKITADDLSSNFVLLDVDVGVQCIHGDRDQADREQALRDLKSGKARVLIATDVASRGLDVKDLTHVLNYDFPRHIEDYVHRIGRTGRAGRSGCALTFVTREDWMHVGKLIPIMEEAGQEIPEDLYEMAERWKQHRERQSEMRFGGGGRGGGGGGRGSGCYKCGKEGHISRSCPEGGTGRGGGGIGFGGGRGGRDRKKERGGISVKMWDAI